jgi:hypothetical protein
MFGKCLTSHTSAKSLSFLVPKPSQSHDAICGVSELHKNLSGGARLFNVRILTYQISLLESYSPYRRTVRFLERLTNIKPQASKAR